MKVYENISLKSHNTFGIDVKVRRLVVVGTDEPLPALEEPYLILGAGSDVVFTRDYPGTVVLLDPAAADAVLQAAGTVVAPAGMVLDSLIQWTLERGVYGLENLSAIPGTVGASVVQNVGAYGVEARDVVSRVEAYDLRERRTVAFSADECRFGYRTSLFKGEPGRWLIRRVHYRLSHTFEPNLTYRALEALPHATAAELRQSITDLRWSKLPRPEEHGSAGSFFKNPVVDEAVCRRLKAEYPDMPEAHAAEGGYKLSAGWLIDRAGWKGRTMGRAGVWPQNALVLYNTGGCTGAEVVTLAEAVRQDVQRRFGIALEPEAIIV